MSFRLFYFILLNLYFEADDILYIIHIYRFTINFLYIFSRLEKYLFNFFLMTDIY